MLLADEGRSQHVMDAAVEDDDDRRRRRSSGRPPGRGRRRTSRPGTVPARAGGAHRAGPGRSAQSSTIAVRPAPRRSRSSDASCGSYGMPRPPPASISRSATPTAIASRRAVRTVSRTCSTSAPASSTFDAPNACRPSSSRWGEATACRAAATRSAASIPNLPAPSSPTRRTRSSRARSETATRSMTGWTRPAARAIASSRASSPGDSTVTARIPAATAAASSSSRLPGPGHHDPAGLDPGAARPGRARRRTRRPRRARADRGAATTASAGLALTA